MFPELMLPQPSPEQVAAAEKALGRRLLPSEIIHGQLLRKPTLHSPVYRERVFGEDAGDALERQIQEARRRVAEEKYAAASPGERELMLLTELQEQTRVKAIAESAAAERVKTAEPLVGQLDKLLQSAAFDPTWDHDAYQVAVVAKQHLTQPSLDAAYGAELFQTAMGIVAERENAKKSEGQKKLDALLVEKMRLEAELGVDSAPASATPASSPHDAAWGEFKAAQDAVRGAKSRGATTQELHKLLNTSEAKFKAYEALKPASPPPATPAPTTEAAA